MSSDSVTCWIDHLKAGDADAAQPLWERYFQRLVGLARKRLQQVYSALGDEEDVALSAFASFVKAVNQNRFPKLEDRHDLWNVLVTITARKACRLIERESRKKRGGGQTINRESTDSPNRPVAEQVIGNEPTPEFAAMVAEEFGKRLDQLGDEKLQQVALLKMQGYTNDEIATQLGCARRTVERRASTIRHLWEEDNNQ